MSIKTIKNVIFAGCISLFAVFSASADMTSSTVFDLGELSDGGFLIGGESFGTLPSGAEVDATYTFSIDEDVQGISIATFGIQASNILSFSQLDAALYDATDQVLGYGSVLGVPALRFTVDPSGSDYSLHIDGLVDGIVGGVYGVVVSAVPLPAAAWLFISAFLGIGGWSVYKRRHERGSALPTGALTA